MGNREKIIDASRDLIHKKGYQSTTVVEILEAAEVKKSNFYYHFKSKEELALIVLESRMEGFREAFLDPTLNNKSLSPSRRITLFFDKIALYHGSLNCQMGCLFGNLATELSDINETFRERLSGFFRQWERDLEKCITEGIRAGEFRSDLNPKTAASLILSMLEGGILLVKTHKTMEPLSRGMEELMKLIEADNRKSSSAAGKDGY